MAQIYKSTTLMTNRSHHGVNTFREHIYVFGVIGVKLGYIDLLA